MKKLLTASILLLFASMTLQAQSCFTLSWEGNGFDHMNIYVTSATYNGSDLEAGDIVGVFDGSTCVGVATLTQVLSGTSYLSIQASKDDPDTPEKDGYTEANQITFRYCLTGGTVEVIDVQSSFTSGTGLFSVSGTAMVELQATNLFTITADAGEGGTITPSGEVPVTPASDQVFTITPDVGYEIADVLVDGQSVGAVTEYIFENVTVNHTISASFAVLTSIALNKPTTSQTAYAPSSYANDGNKLSYWAGKPYPQWWKVDLENVYDITGITLRNYVDGSRYYQYTIEASLDDITYTEIASKTNTNPATDAGDQFEVTTSARYLRVNTSFNSANIGVHICDFRVYGVINESNYLITSSAGPGGTIDPLGEIPVMQGFSQQFIITPAIGYQIEDVLVDGSSVGAVSQYTFENVASNHTLSASFSALPSIALNKPTYSQTAYTPSSYTNDNDVLTYWAGKPYPQWWKVDLENVYDINGIVLRNFVDGSRYYQYIIEVSLDDINYVEIARKDDNNPATEEGDYYTLNSTARYFRVTTTFNSANTGVHICDFRVYGTLNESSFVITSSAGIGGSIDPPGGVPVMYGGSQQFTIVPEIGYQVEDVLVDGVSVGAVAEYTFDNVTSNHTISATFSALASIALNKPTTSQTAYFPSANANDADKFTYWDGRPYPQWWEVDLENIYDITGINLRNYVDGKRYYQYTIEASLDDITYTPVAVKDNTDLATDSGDSYPVSITARYLRVTTTYNSANTSVHISDFKVFGTLHNFNITADCNNGGQIDPLGAVSVVSGSSQSFTITPDFGYEIEDVLIDGTSVGQITEYTFENVSADHTISVAFSAQTSIALNKPTTSQTAYFPSSNANDADKLTYWDGRTYPQWWKVDLEDVYDITGINLRNYVDGKRYYQYIIESSLDDITYTEIASKTSTNIATDEGDSYSLNVTARYLKVTTTFNSANTSVHISDFKAYGTINETNFLITSFAGIGGSISPIGELTVMQGESQTFTVIPDFGYEIDDVLVDGESVGAITEYTFENVTTNHTISATFIALPSVALNKPAVSQSSSYLAYRANDDSKLSYWSANPYPQWWKVDLEDVYDITGMVLRNYVDGSRYYQYIIEASVDDISYTNIASKTSLDPATDDGDIYPVSISARYLRVTTTFNSANIGVHISDFKVYGTLNEGIKGVFEQKSSNFKEDLVSGRNESEMILNVYPNPFSEVITIEVNSAECEVFNLSIIDMTGRVQHVEKDLPCNVSNLIDINLMEGNYHVIVKICGQILNKQVIKL